MQRHIRRGRGRVILAASLRGQSLQIIGVNVVPEAHRVNLDEVLRGQSDQRTHRVRIGVQKAGIVIAVGHHHQIVELAHVRRFRLDERGLDGIPTPAAGMIVMHVIGLDALNALNQGGFVGSEVGRHQVRARALNPVRDHVWGV